MKNHENGGCLIATATFGSELAPQVQQLRELRDNTIQTNKFWNGIYDYIQSSSTIHSHLQLQTLKEKIQFSKKLSK